jgi:hypothetical protein
MREVLSGGNDTKDDNCKIQVLNKTVVTKRSMPHVLGARAVYYFSTAADSNLSISDSCVFVAGTKLIRPPVALTTGGLSLNFQMRGKSGLVTLGAITARRVNPILLNQVIAAP